MSRYERQIIECRHKNEISSCILCFALSGGPREPKPIQPPIEPIMTCAKCGQGFTDAAAYDSGKWYHHGCYMVK